MAAGFTVKVLMKSIWTCGEPVSFLLSNWWPAVVKKRASSEGVSSMDAMAGLTPSTMACHTRLNRRLSASLSKMLTLPLLHPAAKPCREAGVPCMPNHCGEQALRANVLFAALSQDEQPPNSLVRVTDVGLSTIE